MKTVAELLQDSLQAEPEKVIYRFWQDGGINDQLSFATLDQRVRAVAALLQISAPPGERVIIALPQSLHPIVALFACMYTGTVAVPIPLPPTNRLDVLKRYLGDAGSRTIITLAAVASTLKPEAEAAGLKDIQWINMDEIEPASAGSFQRKSIS